MLIMVGLDSDSAVDVLFSYSRGCSSQWFTTDSNFPRFTRLTCYYLENLQAVARDFGQADWQGKKPKSQTIFISTWPAKFPGWVPVFVPQPCFIELVKAQNQTQAQCFVMIKWFVYFLCNM